MIKLQFISNVKILVLLSLFCSCAITKGGKNNMESVREYKIFKSEGFDIQFNEVVSKQFIGLEARVSNNCENMTQANYDLHRYLSIVDPKGQLIMERDSFSVSSHDTSRFDINDHQTFRVNEEIISNYFYKLEQPVSGNYTLKVEFNRNACHFQFEIKQKIQVENK